MSRQQKQEEEIKANVRQAVVVTLSRGSVSLCEALGVCREAYIIAQCAQQHLYGCVRLCESVRVYVRGSDDALGARPGFNT